MQAGPDFGRQSFHGGLQDISQTVPDPLFQHEIDAVEHLLQHALA